VADDRPHIIVEDLRVAWGARVVLDRVSFQIERGITFAILGGSGCGKSTLLRYLIGLEQPQGGRIDIDGVGEPHRYEGIPPFGVLFQSGALFSSMTLEENLALPLTTWTSLRGPIVHDLVQAKLDLVGLGPFARHLPGEISGGMKKRVAIARALVIEPQLILYDEPTSELDPLSAVVIAEEILKLKHRIHVTSMVVSHDRDLAFGVADRIAVINEGRLLTVGTPDEVKAKADPLIQKFLHADLKHL